MGNLLKGLLNFSVPSVHIVHSGLTIFKLINSHILESSHTSVKYVWNHFLNEEIWQFIWDVTLVNVHFFVDIARKVLLKKWTCWNINVPQLSLALYSNSKFLHVICQVYNIVYNIAHNKSSLCSKYSKVFWQKFLLYS